MYSIRKNILFAPITRTLLRLVNSILPILSDLFLMKLNNSFICYVISFPRRSNETFNAESEADELWLISDDCQFGCYTMKCFSPFLGLLSCSWDLEPRGPSFLSCNFSVPHLILSFPCSYTCQGSWWPHSYQVLAEWHRQSGLTSDSLIYLFFSHAKWW